MRHPGPVVSLDTDKAKLGQRRMTAARHQARVSVQASGMRKKAVAWANSALRGIVLIGDLQHDGSGMLPSEAAIGNMNIAGLESQLEDWP